MEDGSDTCIGLCIGLLSRTCRSRCHCRSGDSLQALNYAMNDLRALDFDWMSAVRCPHCLEQVLVEENGQVGSCDRVALRSCNNERVNG